MHSEFEKLKELAQEDTRKKAEADEAKTTTKKRGGGGKKKKTVAKVFQESLNALMEKLRATEHHYIRCLKPNQTLKAGDWDNASVQAARVLGDARGDADPQGGAQRAPPAQALYQYYKVCAEDPPRSRRGR